MYNYQEDIKKSLSEISEKLNVEPKDRPAAYNIHEEIANTLHDISEKVSEGGAGGGPGYEVVPHTETVLFDGEIQAVNIHEINPESENEYYILPLYTDVDGFPDNWPQGTIFVDMTYNGDSQGNIEMRYSENFDIGYYSENGSISISYDLMTRTVYLWPSFSPAEGDVANLHVVGVTERHVIASDDFKEAVGYKITDTPEDQTVEVSDDFKKAVKAAGTGAPPVRYVKTMVPHPFASAFFDLDVPAGDDSLALSYNDIWGENPYVQLVVFDGGYGSVIVQRSGEDDTPVKVSLYNVVSNSSTDYKPTLQLLREYTANSKDDPLMWQS